MKYLLKTDNKHGLSHAKAGDVVYSLRFPDYGLASDDTRMTGIEHRSVTLDPDGGYPSFTHPVAELESQS